ncbi:MAG: RraA family protein [Thaumarchaeota archaeon]|nr:RraA family protein [Nitrososphaerota archaeon]
MAAVFSKLSTPLVADACLRLKVPFDLAPPNVRPLISGSRISGQVVPARHYGSVDVFFEAMKRAEPDAVLIIDNGGRMDEACIGDLTVLEAKASGLSGVIVWGCHRDSEELTQIGFPVFSQGACPSGPQRLDGRGPEALNSARFGNFLVSKQDTVFADDDGVLFTRSEKVEEVLTAANAISKTERKQADEIRAGRKLRDQLQFDSYLDKSASDPSYTFRKHLKTIGGAVEE